MTDEFVNKCLVVLVKDVYNRIFRISSRLEACSTQSRLVTCTFWLCTSEKKYMELN